MQKGVDAHLKSVIYSETIMWTEKRQSFCHNFYKTWPILI